jgi:uncharacterized protein
MMESNEDMQRRREEILAQAQQFAAAQLGDDASGHDWRHAERVANLAHRIAEAESADSYVCRLAAWLHDVADYKIAGDEITGLQRVRAWLETHMDDAAVTEHVLDIIETMSFGGGNRPPMRTLEGHVVQDADRLDAIGAIGIARAFSFGGSRGRVMHDPDQAPSTYFPSKEAYRASRSSTINHFYEKLLLLKDRMHTPLARQLALDRHRYLESFLEEFMEEWQGLR